MWALTILSYDSDLLKNCQKTVWLIEMHRMLVQAYKNQFRAEEAKPQQKGGVAFYFENLKRLSEETRKTILGEMSLPRLKAVDPSQPSPAHQIISERLRRLFAEKKKDFIVVDEKSGLDSEILPMDITIKVGTRNRIIAFIELDGLYHFITREEDGRRIARRQDQLKEELYKFNHPGIPLLRVDLMTGRRYEEYAEALYKRIKSHRISQYRLSTLA
jgi:hypothetical protein